MPEILSLIRSETRTGHAHVESLIPIFNSDFDMARYRLLLEHFYGFYLGFESLIDSVPNLAEIVTDWTERRKLPRLIDDLLFLGYSRSDLALLAVCRQLPPVATLPSAVGALYVTEGSTLGGQVICRHLAQSLQLVPGNGASFFSGHGHQTGAKWRTFTTALSSAATAENQQEIVRSAVDTFRSIGFWLSQDSANHQLPNHEKV